MSRLNQTAGDKFEAPETWAAFRKSSFCNAGTCVAVAVQTDGTVFVRDTKDDNQPTLAFSRDEWSAFVKGVKHGEFDVDAE